jgi:hypothetical protein
MNQNPFFKSRGDNREKSSRLKFSVKLIQKWYYGDSPEQETVDHPQTPGAVARWTEIVLNWAWWKKPITDWRNDIKLMQGNTNSVANLYALSEKNKSKFRTARQNTTRIISYKNDDVGYLHSPYIDSFYLFFNFISIQVY